jgi:hypothetical protein
VSSTKASRSGIACGICSASAARRTLRSNGPKAERAARASRVSALKVRCPWPSRRTRQKKVHFGCVHARASRRTWCLAARGWATTAHIPRRAHQLAATECMGTAEVERTARLALGSRPSMTHGLAALCCLSYIRNHCEPTRGQYRGAARGKFLKNNMRPMPDRIVACACASGMW